MDLDRSGTTDWAVWLILGLKSVHSPVSTHLRAKSDGDRDGLGVVVVVVVVVLLAVVVVVSSFSLGFCTGIRLVLQYWGVCMHLWIWARMDWLIALGFLPGSPLDSGMEVVATVVVLGVAVGCPRAGWTVEVE